jgi:hypothetical protein
MRRTSMQQQLTISYEEFLGEYYRDYLYIIEDI